MAYEGKPSSAFADMPIVQEHIHLAASELVTRMLVRFTESIEFGLKHSSYLHFDSPLEVLFYVWWEMAATLDQRLNDEVEIYPQQEVTLGDRLYRLDFMIRPSNPILAASKHWTPLAVEVDGHAFHERTKEQVTLRDQRDRALQVAGWKVFHFSYSEFVNNPFMCVEEVRGFAIDNFNRASTRQVVEESVRRRGEA